MTKIAIIGAGYMAREHIKALMAVDGTEVCGVMGRTEAKAKALCDDMGIAVCAQSVEELFTKTQADAVVIAVNILSSPEIIDQALDHPWVILAEKPVSLELDDAHHLERKRAALQRQVYVAMNRRHYASTRQAAALLDADHNPRVVEVHDQENIIGALNSGVPEQVASSWMVANSIHLIDYFSMFCRGQLTAVTLNAELDPNAPFFTSAFLEYDSGDNGIYTAIWNAPGPWGVKITTAHQMLEMRPLEGLERQVFPEKRKQGVELSDDDKRHKPGLYLQARELVAAVNGQAHSLPTLNDQMATHELVNKLYPNKIAV